MSLTEVPYKVCRNRWGGVSYYYKRPPPRFQILERSADHCLVSTMLQWQVWPEGAQRTRCKVYHDGRVEIWNTLKKEWVDWKKTCLKIRSIRELHFRVFSDQFVYDSKDAIPPMKRGLNVFVTAADPWNNGWWKTMGNGKLRRLIPNYFVPRRNDRMENRLWPSETA